MCVIMCAETHRPSADMARAGFKDNDKGAGFAWRELAIDKKGNQVLNKDGSDKLIVHWKKAMTDIDEVVHLIETLPLPYIYHCRIPSVGGPTLDLTHPFPVSRDVSVAHEGQIDGSVLFHNGTWSKWNDEMIKGALNARVKLPRGPHSDSRMMAWMTHLLGGGFLEILNEKAILFSADDIEIFGTNRGWVCINDVWCSNGGFQSYNKRFEPADRTTPRELGPATRFLDIVDGPGGDRPPAGFRPGPSSVGNPGPNDPPENIEGQNEGRQEGDGTPASEGVEVHVITGAQPRHPLIADTEFAKEYRKMHGHAPPFMPRPSLGGVPAGTGNIIGNPKRFRASGRGGDPVLEQRRADADRGITHVL